MQSVHSYMNALLFFDVFFLKGGLELRTERSRNLCEKSFNSIKNGPCTYIRECFTVKYYTSISGLVMCVALIPVVLELYCTCVYP